jgi:putative Mn2+ efflux pump MntP
MDLFGTIIISIGLAMDAFAVSLCVGTNGAAMEKRSVLRLAFHFGLFQGLMTFLGWLAGSTISRWIAQFDHWIAFGLLLMVGVNMIRSGFNQNTESYKTNPTKGSLMVMLSVATSIDALAVGLSLALLNTSILQAALLIGIITFGLSLGGLMAGFRLGAKFGKKMEILGGSILIGIGIRILLTHLLA